tara:strand:- start:9785 stop:9991 length:207 start_codon:yes stop_codon:yes gene_type:complete
MPQSSKKVNFRPDFSAIAKKMGQNEPKINIIRIMRKTRCRDAALSIFSPPLLFVRAPAFATTPSQIEM